MNTMRMILLPNRLVEFKRLQTHILIAAICGLLCQCSVTDSNFNTLSSIAEISPSKDAILGMWYREYVDNLLGEKYTRSLLFQSNGHGFHRAYSKSNMLLFDAKDDAEASFTWNYTGGGVWSISYDKYKAKVTCRIAGNHLLYEQGSVRLVFRRTD